MDLDLAVLIRTRPEFESFILAAERFGFEPSSASFSNPVVVLTDQKTGMEVELWLRPDGIVWDRGKRFKVAWGLMGTSILSSKITY